MSKTLASIIGLVLTIIGSVFITLPKTTLMDKNDEDEKD